MPVVFRRMATSAVHGMPVVDSIIPILTTVSGPWREAIDNPSERTMSEKTIQDLVIECVTGDIVRQPDMDAIVNAANAQLRIGGGVAGAIHRAAGPGLEEECRPLAPIEPGQAVITGGHDLPNRYVIHCLGPVYGQDEPAAELLARCYRNALRLAEEAGIRSIAFPAISTGAFGYPLAEAARVALRTVADSAPELASVRQVRFVLHDPADLRVHADRLEDLDG
jgi:O-acetyl-ADP-ribose deacetylase (regulator of RNase III)